MSKSRSALPSRSAALWGALGLATAVAGASCSAARGTNTTQFTSGSGGTAAGTPSGSGGSGPSGSGGGVGSGFVVSSGTSGSGGLDPDGGCAGTATTAQQLPLDMYIMLDQSGSMTDPVMGGGNKWMAVTGALQAFVSQPGLSGISVGIQYFGQPPGGASMCPMACATDADCGSAACGPCFFGTCLGGSGGSDSCNAVDYTKPEVEIAPLPGVAGAIITSMGMHMPSTSTPTQPALQGAIDHAKAWAAMHPGHVVVAVLATDGAPTECAVQDGPGLAQIAAAGLSGTPSVKTFTIGIFASSDIPSGPNLLNDISAGGGTTKSFTIDTANQNTNQQFLMALNAIRGASLGCQYKIPVPTAGMLDYTKVNVQYSPGGGGPAQDFPKSDDKAHCPATGDGWYYDNNAAPTQILLCDKTCAKVGADSTGTVNIVLGCQTKLN